MTVETPPSSASPGPTPGAPPPLPQGVQRIILVLTLAAAVGLFFLFRETADVHSVHDALAYQGTASFQVSGEVLPTSEENLALRAMDGHESFTLGDPTGQLAVYYRAGDLARPADGARVTVEGSKVSVSGQGRVAFVASSLVTD